MMAERLRRIRSRSGHRSRRGPSAAASHTKFVEERVRKGPPPPAEGTGRARRELRDMVLRLLKPYSVHQRQVDEDLMRVLRVLEESIEGLAAQQETLREEVEPALRLVRPTDLDGVAAGGELPDAPVTYWSPEYIERQREFVAKVLDDPQLLNLFKHRQQLPPRYGVRFDERVVEFPWVASRPLSGRVLDAGSTLNHPHVLTRLRPRVDELHIATLAPEAEAYPSLDISYLYADLRELPMSDGAYDHVVSISTLEHVGMDTSQYGARGTRAEDPREELRRALAELRRVLKPGGTLYVTVPYGKPEDHGWLRQFGSDELDELVEAFGPAEREVTYYGYEPSGWRLVEDPARLADKRYRDHFSQPLADDGAAAARAVACLELIAPR
jgi:SAM-dependent methyltransferase